MRSAVAVSASNEAVGRRPWVRSWKLRWLMIAWLRKRGQVADPLAGLLLAPRGGCRDLEEVVEEVATRWAVEPEPSGEPRV